MAKYAHLAVLVLAVVVCQLAGLFGSLYTFDAIPTWYASLEKPFFSPPNWVFGPVWITLYTLMGLAVYLVWRQGWDNIEVKKGVFFFSVQLVLNALWSFIFFGLRDPAKAFFEIALLWLAIVVTMRQFWKVSKKAYWLMVPYLAWVTFAAILNLFIWQLNP